MKVSINGITYDALVDTGAAVSLIAGRVYDSWQNAGIKLQASPVRLQTVSGQELPTKGKVRLDVRPFGLIDLCVVERMGADIIIGSDTLDEVDADVLYKDRRIRIRGGLYPCWKGEKGDCMRVTVGPVETAPAFLQGIEKHPVFRNELGHCIVGEPATIRTSCAPIKQHPYRLNLLKRRIVEEQVDQMLQQKVIRPSQSPWSSPITLTSKKDGSTRFCVDYRRLNAATEKDAYPVPLIQDIFDQLQGATVFTTLDLRSGYHQMDLAEEDRPKSAFVCHRGLFEFNRLPFGLTNAPAQFQRMMNNILQEHLGRRALVYLDDIVIYSKSEDEHIRDVRTVLSTIHTAGLTLKLSKCRFGLPEVDLLGYTISGRGIAQQEDKVQAIRDMAAPKDIKALQRYLGLSGYYRQTIPGYAEKAVPLVALTRKNTPWKWGPEEQKAFEMIREELTSDRVMAHPRVHDPYLLYTDASAYAVGAILAQTDEQGIERPIHYVSKQLTDSQQKWSAIEREAFAIIYALHKLRPYLQGARFTVYTDHKPLKSLFQCEVKNTRVQRWAQLISEFGPSIEYRRGEHNQRADMLSRLPAAAEVATLQTTLLNASVGEQQRQEYSNEWAQAEAADDLDDDGAEFVILEGELYSLRQPYQGAPHYPRLLAPPSIQLRLLQEAHEETGHRGLFSLLRRLQAFAVWKGMRSDAKRLIRNCPHCQGNRRNPMATRPQHTETPQHPFERVGVDITGPFLPSPAGNKYLLNAVDHLTGWAECFPLPDKRAVTVWSTLERELFPRHGHPRIIITDQGMEFSNAIFKNGCNRLCIEHRRTTPYHPQANGVVERFHRTLKDCLRKLLNNNTAQWETELPRALWAYRISDSQSRGSSPFALLYGREPDRTDVLDLPGEPHASQRYAIQKMEEAKLRRQEKSRHLPLSSRNINVGDMITIDAPEAITLAHLRNHAFRVVEVRGKVVAYVKPFSSQPNQVHRIHIDRVRSAPAEISWDDIRPRPLRSRSGPDVRTLTAAPPLTMPPVQPICGPADQGQATPREQQPTDQSHEMSMQRLVNRRKVTSAPGPANAGTRPKAVERRRQRGQSQCCAKRQRCSDSSDSEMTSDTDSQRGASSNPLQPAAATNDTGIVYQGPVTRSRSRPDQAIDPLERSKPQKRPPGSDWTDEEPPTAYQKDVISDGTSESF